MPGLFGSLVSGLRRAEAKATDASALTGLFSQPNARSGVSVTIDSALKVSTVFACLRVLADLNPIEGLNEPLLPLNMATQAQRAAVPATGET